MFPGSEHFLMVGDQRQPGSSLNRESHSVPGLAQQDLQVCDHFSFLQEERSKGFITALLISAPSFRNRSVIVIKATSKKLVTDEVGRFCNRQRENLGCPH